MFDLPPCAFEIADYYKVPIELIAAVRMQEGGKVCKKDGPRFNGSYDHGPMQINSWWFEEHQGQLQQFGITEYSVTCNFCQNVSVGTWILAQELERYKDIDKALSAYNSGKPKYNGYSTKVLDKLKTHFNPNFVYLHGED